MDLNRHQFFFIGLLVLLIGVQVRYVSAYVLNPEATQFLAERRAIQTAGMSIVFCRHIGNVRCAAKSAAAARVALLVPDLGRRRACVCTRLAMPRARLNRLSANSAVVFGTLWQRTSRRHTTHRCRRANPCSESGP